MSALATTSKKFVLRVMACGWRYCKQSGLQVRHDVIALVSAPNAVHRLLDPIAHVPCGSSNQEAGNTRERVDKACTRPERHSSRDADRGELGGRFPRDRRSGLSCSSANCSERKSAVQNALFDDACTNPIGPSLSSLQIVLGQTPHDSEVLSSPGSPRRSMGMPLRTAKRTRHPEPLTQTIQTSLRSV